VLAQAADFQIELVIGEDCSTDNTRAIINDFIGRFPGRIRLLAHDKNVGMNANFAATLEACRGEYIALLEGDDYWTDNTKLSQQAEFLDQHPDCVNCFHNVRVISDVPRSPVQGYYSQSDGTKLMCAPDMPSRFGQGEFLKRNVIPTCSVMFRKSSMGELPAWFPKLSMGDQPLHILCTQHGASAYDPGVMGVYRLHGQSAWVGKAAAYRISKTIEMYEALERYFENQPQSKILLDTRLHWMREQARIFETNGEYSEAIRIYRQVLATGFKTKISFKLVLKLVRKIIKLRILSCLPWLMPKKTALQN
jgi:glycosyltransferase involved in cell wall biosynthesis